MCKSSPNCTGLPSGICQAPSSLLCEISLVGLSYSDLAIANFGWWIASCPSSLSRPSLYCYTPHRHAREGFPDHLNDSIFECFWAPFNQRLGRVSSLAVTPSEPYCAFIPYDRSEGAAIKEMAHGFLVLITRETLR